MVSPVKSLSVCEWKAKEFRRASGEKKQQVASRTLKESCSLHLHTCVCVCACAVNLVKLFETPWTAAHQAPLSPRLPKNKKLPKNLRLPKARTLEWVTISFRGSSPSKDQIRISCVSYIDRRVTTEPTGSFIFT